jgi:hypothetical protein
MVQQPSKKMITSIILVVLLLGLFGCRHIPEPPTAEPTDNKLHETESIPTADTPDNPSKVTDQQNEEPVILSAEEYCRMTGPADWQTFKNDDFGIQFDYPIDWIAYGYFTGGMIDGLEETGHIQAVGMEGLLNISVYPAEDLSLLEWAKKYGSNIPGLESNSTINAKLNGQDAIMYLASYTPDGRDELFVISRQGENVLALIYYMTPHKHTFDIFKRLLNSFSVSETENPEPEWNQELLKTIKEQFLPTMWAKPMPPMKNPDEQTYKTFTSKEYDFSIDLPDYWEVYIDRPGPKMTGTLQRLHEWQFTGDYSVIMLDVWSYNTNASFEEIKNHASIFGMNIPKLKEKEFAGKDASWILERDLPNYGEFSVFIFRDGQMVHLAYRMQKPPSEVQLVKSIMESFRFNDMPDVKNELPQEIFDCIRYKIIPGNP